MARCGVCEACRIVARTQKRVLACCGTPKKNGTGFNHADDDVVAVWNKTLEENPCEQSAGTHQAVERGK